MSRLFRLLCAGCIALVTVSATAHAIDVTWDGGDGAWDDANWNGGKGIDQFLGRVDGTDGWKGPNEDEVENIVIGKGATVEYLADELQSDFRMLQGSTLTITEGAVWTQSENDDWSENRWTEMDLSVLNLDNGTFRRTGVVQDEGGGALIFGSWKGDDTFNEPDSELDHQEITINITNGGRLENEGQLWFGGWTDTPSNGTVVTMNINDGVVDLTGGDFAIEDWGNADLIFSNRFAANGIDEDQPTYTINFTGPGSIIVDETGILNMNCIDSEGDDCIEWSDDDPITYQALWDIGILQADGVTGPAGDFNQYFIVTGQLGNDNYTLTSKLGSVRGDFNGDLVVNATDIDLLSTEAAAGTNDSAFDLTGDGLVNQADRTEWIEGVMNTYVGDSNLDGVFNSGDFVLVFTAGEYEDALVGNSTWATGDWNGDKEFNSGDFVAAFSANGYEMPPRPAAVPEPSTIAGLFIAVAFATTRRRRA
ncbi:MAG: PEP-CTERM sorting domain-containing protein [Planctomycetales bacterium]|nr:PEP-CTERM sorting domain-containing protein [Planctomycetales bacterium]